MHDAAVNHLGDRWQRLERRCCWLRLVPASTCIPNYQERGERLRCGLVGALTRMNVEAMQQSRFPVPAEVDPIRRSIRFFLAVSRGRCCLAAW